MAVAETFVQLGLLPRMDSSISLSMASLPWRCGLFFGKRHGQIERNEGRGIGQGRRFAHTAQVHGTGIMKINAALSMW